MGDRIVDEKHALHLWELEEVDSTLGCVSVYFVATCGAPTVHMGTAEISGESNVVIGKLFNVIQLLQVLLSDVRCLVELADKQSHTCRPQLLSCLGYLARSFNS